MTDRRPSSLLDRAAVLIHDGQPALRLAHVVRAWKLFPAEGAWLRAVAAGTDAERTEVKRQYAFDGLTHALSVVREPTGGPEQRAQYRADLIAESLRFARKQLEVAGQWYGFWTVEPELAAEPGISPPAEPDPSSPADAARIAGLRQVAGRSRDQHLLLDAFLEHGWNDMEEVAHFLDWKAGRVYMARKRLLEKYEAALARGLLPAAA